MKRLICFLFIGFTIVSCHKGEDLSDELIDDWDYSYKFLANKPEVQMTFNIGVDYGTISFKCDGTGNWDSNFSSNNEMNWFLDSNEQNITITKSKDVLNPTVLHTTEYMVTRIDELNYLLVKEYTFHNDPDLIVSEEISLKRII